MPRVLVVNTLDASVVFFDATTRKKLKTVKVGQSPQGIALARNGKFGYVANAGAGTVSVLDVIRMTETTTLSPDGIDDPGDIAVLPDGRSLFVTSADGQGAAVIGGQSGVVRNRIELQTDGSNGLAVSPAGDRVWMCDGRGGAVVGVDPRNGTTIRVPVEGRPAAVALARDGKTLLVSCSEPARLVRVDSSTGRELGSATVGINPVAVAGHPYADQAFVLSKGGGSVFVVDLATMEAARPISVGLGPSAFAVARAGKVLYVANSDSDSLSVVDVAKGNVSDTWETGHHPGAVAFLS